MADDAWTDARLEDVVSTYLTSLSNSSTRAVYGSTLRRFSAAVGCGRPIGDLTRHEVVAFLDQYQQFAAASTYNSNRLAIKSFSRWCLQQGYTIFDFALGVKRRTRSHAGGW
jgi:hypothetical protein